MFSTTTHKCISHMPDYEHALRVYNNIKPIRGRADTNERPLAQRRNDNLTIRLEPSTGDVVVRLYYTDIVRYKSDGKHIVVEPYSTCMTAMIVRAILRDKLGAPLWTKDKITTYSHLDRRFYHTPQTMTLDEYGKIIEGVEPYRFRLLNQTSGRKALKQSRYYEFCKWAKTCKKLGIPMPEETWDGGRERCVIERLKAGPEYWQELRHIYQRDWQRANMRQTIYSFYECYEDHEMPYLESLTDLENLIRRSSI